MGRLSSVVICIIGTLAILACVFGDNPSGEIHENFQKPSDGLSTASDTLAREAESISLDGLSVDELRKLRDSVEKRAFRTEVGRMMQLIVDSLYKQKEIFLRELISNASDALDKIRMQSLTDPDIMKDTEELAVRIKANKESRTLHIIDTGVGMTAEELSENLGTIAKSGTSEFLSKVLKSNQTSESSELIGQFGVGFYSAFLVSDKVTVISKNVNDKQYIWESDSTYFSLFEDPRGNTLKRGTEIILHLKEDAVDFLEEAELERVAKKYSQFLRFPIYLWSSRTIQVKDEDSEEKSDDKKSDDDVSVEEDKKSEAKMVEKIVWEWKRINKSPPIWTRKPADVTDEEYKTLYQTLSHVSDKYLGKVHFSAEGDVSFKCVLFIPARAPHNMFQHDFSHDDRIKLYVQRVFIRDSAAELIPKYLVFVTGIVDSDDLPLNVSREMLQQNQLMKIIKRKIVRKTLEMISKLTDEDFQTFWKEYGTLMKLGVTQDSFNRARLSKILRYFTSKCEEKQCSFEDYVGRMKKDQSEIYYLTASSLAEAKSSPMAERLIKKGYEVVYMVDPIDEYVVQHLTEFDKRPLKNIAKGELKLGTSEHLETQKKSFEKLLKWLQEDALKDKIEKAELSQRLSESPCALVAKAEGWTGNMERVVKSQSLQRDDDVMSSYYMGMKRILEINPRHPLIKELNSRVKVDDSDKEAHDTAQLLFHVAHLRSGYMIRDPVEFASKLELIMRKTLDIDENEKVDDDPELIEGDSENVEQDEEKVEVSNESKYTESDAEPTKEAGLDEGSQSADAKDEL